MLRVSVAGSRQDRGPTWIWAWGRASRCPVLPAFCVSTLRKDCVMVPPLCRLSMNPEVGWWLESREFSDGSGVGGWHGLCWSRRMRSVMLFMCLLAATACDEKSPVGPTVALNERFTLAPSEAATIRDAGPGRAVRGSDRRFAVSRGRGLHPGRRCACAHSCARRRTSLSSYELHTGDSSRATVTHKQVRIALVELQPYPFSSRTIAPGGLPGDVDRDALNERGRSR